MTLIQFYLSMLEFLKVMKKILVADNYNFHILEVADNEDISKYTVDYIEKGKQYGDWKWYYTFGITKKG